MVSLVTKKFAVFGNPISQSKSPLIHCLFAESLGLDIQYEAIQGQLEKVEDDFQRFFSDQDACGANVTMPFKDNAAAWVDELTDQAKAAGAVNTIIRQENRFLGDSTDGVGLTSDLARLGFEITHKRVLLIGAGGAARGAIANILNTQPLSIDILNRSFDKAQILANVVSNKITKCISSPSDLGCYDLIINATSLSLSDKLPLIEKQQLHTDTCLYDMVYKNTDTSFIQWAKQNGCNRVSDGLGMLVGQAAESFYLWTGQRPEVKPVLATLRAQLSA